MILKSSDDVMTLPKGEIAWVQKPHDRHEGINPKRKPAIIGYGRPHIIEAAEIIIASDAAAGAQTDVSSRAEVLVRAQRLGYALVYASGRLVREGEIACVRPENEEKTLSQAPGMVL